MKITINYDPPNWNTYINAERRNRYAAAKIKKDEKMIVLAAVRGKKWKGGYPVKVTVYPHFRTLRKDLDNTRVKGIIDGLVGAGVIENDNLTHIQGLEYIPVFDNRDCIEIKIERIEGGR